jgi:DNA replication protein DnaC
LRGGAGNGLASGLRNTSAATLLALAVEVVEAGYQGYFSSAADMCAAIAASYALGSFDHRIRTYTKPTVLVIDDVGLIPFSQSEANVFFQVVNRRYEMGRSRILTTNRGLASGESFSETRWSRPRSWTGSCTGR